MNMTRIRQICLRLSKLKKTDYIVILLVGVLLLIVVLPVKDDKKICSNSQKKAKAKSVSESTYDDEEYEKLLEKKLEGILERMDGVGEVSVMITLSDDGTRIVDKFEFEGIPTFAPEHFARVSLVDSMKRKQFVKGVTQIAQEGAIQMFQEYKGGMEEIIVGVVGVLQFDVLKFRLENEYNVQIRLENLPYEHIRWIENKDEVNVDTINGTSDMKKVVDMKGNPLLLFINEWSIGMTLDRNDGLVLTEFGRN